MKENIKAILFIVAVFILLGFSKISQSNSKPRERIEITAPGHNKPFMIIHFMPGIVVNYIDEKDNWVRIY